MLFTTAREIGPESGIAKELPLYCTGTRFSNLCIALAPVLIFTILTTANQKASSKTVVHKSECCHDKVLGTK
jgi:hypothetical protein